MKIGDNVYVHGIVDEIRKDVVIIRNDGGYFGTTESEIRTSGCLTDLYIKDVHSGTVHRIGDDPHDMLTIDRGQLRYYNLQNGDGCTLGDTGMLGGYVFVDNTDEYGYNYDPREKAND